MRATQLTDYLGRKIRLTAERRRHIVKTHPEMAEWVDSIGSVLSHPEKVVRSRSDPEAELFYIWQPRTRVGPKYLCSVVVVKKDDAFVLTAYLTDSIKRGQVLWPRNEG
jgi:hypothetical protein